MNTGPREPIFFHDFPQFESDRERARRHVLRLARKQGFLSCQPDDLDYDDRELVRAAVQAGIVSKADCARAWAAGQAEAVGSTTRRSDDERRRSEQGKRSATTCTEPRYCPVREKEAVSQPLDPRLGRPRVRYSVKSLNCGGPYPFPPGTALMPTTCRCCGSIETSITKNVGCLKPLILIALTPITVGISLLFLLHHLFIARLPHQVRCRQCGCVTLAE